MSLLDIFKKNNEISNNEVENETIEIPDGGDFILYCKHDGNFDFGDLEQFYSKYDLNVNIEYEVNANDFWVKITDTEDEGINFFTESSLYKKELLLEANYSEELVNKFDSEYLIEAKDFREALMILVLILYISDKTEVLVYDTYNGVYLDKNKIKELIDNEYKK